MRALRCKFFTKDVYLVGCKKTDVCAGFLVRQSRITNLSAHKRERHPSFHHGRVLVSQRMHDDNKTIISIQDGAATAAEASPQQLKPQRKQTENLFLTEKYNDCPFVPFFPSATPTTCCLPHPTKQATKLSTSSGGTSILPCSPLPTTASPLSMSIRPSPPSAPLAQHSTHTWYTSKYIIRRQPSQFSPINHLESLHSAKENPQQHFIILPVAPLPGING